MLIAWSRDVFSKGKQKKIYIIYIYIDGNKKRLTQQGDETHLGSKLLGGPPVAIVAFWRKAVCKRAWPRAAQDFGVQELFFCPSDSFWRWSWGSRGSAALPLPCVLPVHVRGSAAWLVVPAFLSRSVLPAPWALLPPVLFLPGSAAFLPPWLRLGGPSPAAGAGAAWRASGCHGS